MPALPLKADLMGSRDERLLVTLSGHSVECAVRQMGTENQGFPYRAVVLLLTVRTHCM